MIVEDDIEAEVVALGRSHIIINVLGELNA